MENDTAGDPMSARKWSRKSIYSISKKLQAHHIPIAPSTTSQLLKKSGYSLKSNRKEIAETLHPDRDQQFTHIAETKADFETQGLPIISVDSKKKELIGNFKNPGKTWCKKPPRVLTHDFRSQAKGIANPFGIYEPVVNKGTVVVGTSYDTPEFAVNAIELWLTHSGMKRFPDMDQLLILCDAGGSNSYRARAWKYFLYQKICRKYDIKVTVCHYPAGASKWNPIDHRMFSFISIHWAGVPLRSYRTMLNCIRKTTTKSGLQISAIFHRKRYEKGIKISDEQMNQINIIHHEPLPQWNYSILPD
jgi:hypothetical protein